MPLTRSISVELEDLELCLGDELDCLSPIECHECFRCVRCCECEWSKTWSEPDDET